MTQSKSIETIQIAIAGNVIQALVSMITNQAMGCGKPDEINTAFRLCASLLDKAQVPVKPPTESAAPGRRKRSVARTS